VDRVLDHSLAVKEEIKADTNTSGNDSQNYPSSHGNGSRITEHSEAESNGNDQTNKEEPQNKSFFMSADLDTTRINRDVQKLVEEVISHLTSVDGSTVEVSLEVNMKAPNGTPVSTVRTVMENCKTLKVKEFGFDE